MANEATMMAAVPRHEPSAIVAETAAAKKSSWLLCRARTHLCALPLAHVIEVTPLLPIEAVVGAPPYVRGLCIIRGAVLPVVDAGLLLGERATIAERFVVVRTGNRTLALAVDAVLGISAIDDETRSELPPLLRDTAGETIAAVGMLDAELLFFLRTTLAVPVEWLDRLTADGVPA